MKKFPAAYIKWFFQFSILVKNIVKIGQKSSPSFDLNFGLVVTIMVGSTK